MVPRGIESDMHVDIRSIGQPMISMNVDKYSFLRHPGFHAIAIFLRQPFQPHHFQLGSHHLLDSDQALARSS